jgi:hypothetical protein
MAQGRIVTSDADPTKQMWWDGKSLSTPTPQQLQGATQVKLSSPDAKAIAEYNTAAQDKAKIAAAGSDFMRRNAQTDTGGFMAIPGVADVMKAMPWANPNLSGMDRDAMVMATNLRAPSQRLTQMEIIKNLASGPSIKTTLAGNASTQLGVDQENTLAQAQASFYSAYGHHRGTLDGVIPAWLAFKSDHFAQDGSYSHAPLSSGGAPPAQAAQGSQATMAAPAPSQASPAAPGGPGGFQYLGVQH